MFASHNFLHVCLNPSRKPIQPLAYGFNKGRRSGWGPREKERAGMDWGGGRKGSCPSAGPQTCDLSLDIPLSNNQLTCSVYLIHLFVILCSM